MIFEAQGAPTVLLTPVANGKIFNQKSLNIFFGHIWIVELTHRFKFYLRCNQSDIVPIISHHCGVIDTSGKFTAGVVDTRGKFAAGVIDTTGAP
jgi:hypothetical protein